MTTEIMTHFDNIVECEASFAHLTLKDLLGHLQDDLRLQRAIQAAFSEPNPMGGSPKINSVAELASMPDEAILQHRNIGPLGIAKIDQALHKLVAL